MRWGAHGPPRLLAASADEEAAAGDEAARALAAAPRPHAEAVPRSAARAVVVFSAALLAVTLARVPAASPALLTAAAASGATSLEAGGSEEALATGCHNWKAASMEYFTARDADHCVQSCREKAGCIAVNFQVDPCASEPPELHGVDRTCHLLDKSCDTGPNRCWKLITLPENCAPDCVDGGGVLEADPEADSDVASMSNGSEQVSDTGASPDSGDDGADTASSASASSGYPPDATGATVFADFASNIR